jgi:TIR domain
MSLAFISYRREDSAGYAGRLHESLERRLGEGEVFRDADTLEPGQDFVDAIAARMRDCKVCLVLIGREWLHLTDGLGRRRLEQENDYVRLEIASALTHPNLLVIPVLVEGVSMPTDDQLPPSIRALSRRHAASLRDETWDSDVDRLVGALRKSIGRREQPAASAAGVSFSRAFHPPRRMAIGVLLAVALLTAIFVARNSRSSDDRGSAPAADAGNQTRRSDVAAGAPAYGIGLPRLSEVAHGSVIYTLLAGGVVRHDATNTLRLRFRFSNEGRYPANFWDNAFRLALQGQVLAPTSGLNDVVEGYAVRQAVVTFEVPAATTNAVLRVLVGDTAAELPLDLRSSGDGADVEKIDTGGALSRAIVARIVREARPIGSGTDVSYTLVSATARRFVNTLRVVATVRVTNHRTYPWHFAPDAVQVLADGNAIAPVSGPNKAVAAGNMAMADFVFDVVPSVQQLSLRLKGAAGAEAPLELPAAVR